MKTRTAIAVVIMAASFFLSFICLCVSGALYVASGTKELAHNICTGDWDRWSERFDWISVDKKDGLKVDTENFDLIIDEEGVDLDFLFIHFNTRDVDDEEADD